MMDNYNEKVTLLIVDDEKDFLEASAQALVRRGFVVETALDGATALSMIAEQAYDVVLLDIKMPGLNGVEVFQHIKRMSPGLPVIMLTGHGNIQQAFETSKDGVFQYLTKPCSIEQIIDVVRAAVNHTNVRDKSISDAWTEAIRVLIVDKDSDSTQSLCSALRNRELQITCASNTEEAFRLLENLYFDVVLVEYETSNGHSDALIKYIRQLHPLVEIILIVTLSTSVNIIDDIRNNIYGVFVKPINPNLAERKIKAAHSRRKRKQSEQQKNNIRDILERKTD